MGFRFNVRRSLGAGLIPGDGGTILKPQDVFATSLWTGNGTTRVIPTGFKPDLMWNKRRDAAGSHILADTLRGTNVLSTDTTAAESDFGANAMTSQDTGAGIIGSAALNNSGNSNVLWAWKRAAKFFDIVTWTGDGTSNRLIPHGLGVVPGMVIVKRRDGAANWIVTHRSLTQSLYDYLLLNGTTGQSNGDPSVFGTGTNATNFVVGNGLALNANNLTYVAYLFAHDPSADGIVQCGLGTANGSGVFTIPHGWSGGAQWFLYKRIDAAQDWYIADTARSASNFAGADPYLSPNLSAAEASSDFASQSSGVLSVLGGNPSGQYIWAIIRAPY